MIRTVMRRSFSLARSPIYISPFARSFTSNSVTNTKTSTYFQKNLPDIHEPSEHFRTALKSSRRIKKDNTMMSTTRRARKMAKTRIQALVTNLTSPLTAILKAYESSLKKLSQFEAVVANLTITALHKKGNSHLNDILKRVETLRAHVSVVGKYYLNLVSEVVQNSIEGRTIAALAEVALGQIFEVSEQEYSSLNAHSPTAESKRNKQRTGKEELLTSETFKAISNKAPKPQAQLSHCLEELMVVQKALRRVPELDMLVPTIVLVGAPNVGKSSIVRMYATLSGVLVTLPVRDLPIASCVSSGVPEVADYPFTTRGLSIGHMVLKKDDGFRVQIMDTPGLLDRPEDLRNEMEKLTYASMAHLPTAVMFVLDPTGLAGDKSALRAQLRIREALRCRFPRRPWIDVVSKADIEICDDIKGILPQGHIHISSVTGENIPILKEAIAQRIVDLLEAFREMPAATAQDERKEDPNQYN